MPAWAGGPGRRPLRHSRSRRPRWLAPLLLVLATILAIWLNAPLAPSGDLPETLVGPARAYDGDTLGLTDRSGGLTRIRLIGLDAPELLQTCADAGGAAWPCGMTARQELSRLIGASGDLACAPTGYDRYDRVLASCTAGSDLGAQLVEAGLAVADGRYAAQERRARDAGAGIWAGDFQRPADWRREHPRDDAQPAVRTPVTILIDWVGNVFNR